jgi:hypothetical protein
LSFRGDVKSRVDTDSPDSAIFMSDHALNRSARMYMRYVTTGQSGSSEKKGRKIGAWWYTPPS